MKKGFAKPGIVQWLVADCKNLGAHVKERVVQENNKMVGNLKDMGLPHDRDFGSFACLDEAALFVPEQLREDGRFIIRCVHRVTGAIERDLFVPWSQVEKFVASLPGGYQNYKLGIREVSIPIWSGTIICLKTGETLIELWKGKHLEMDTIGSVKTSFRGLYDPKQIYFRWSRNCRKLHKVTMIEALRFVASDLRPKEPLFVEFNLTEKNGYRFIGASRDPFWTGGAM